jgi:nucleoside-diphosphate-sugar epimerase
VPISDHPLNEVNANKPLVAVAGASGFVGSHLRQHLSEVFRFRALTRSPAIVEQGQSDPSTEWTHCDLYSLPQVSEALQGCEYGLYLVHSMAPSSRLMQGSFEDTDLLIADNFIRAAESAGLKQIIYLSGLMPEEDEPLSPHLRSRLEVERVLKSRSVKVTVLRAGLIFGPGGSSFSMLINLVNALPVMLLPVWVRSTTQSIDIQNICEAFELCLTDDDFASGEVYDLGGHEPMTYRALILKTAAFLGKRVRTYDIPWNLLALSRHWVAHFGKVPVALVGPLQESLRHNLRARPNALLDRLSVHLLSLEDSLANAVGSDGQPRSNPRTKTQAVDSKQIKQEKRVRSVQRMPLPADFDAQQISHEYGRWLSRTFANFINAETDPDGVVRFYALFKRLKLLELTPTPLSFQNKRRCAYYISGGFLSTDIDPPGRFEFRLFPSSGCIIASIHGFAPKLPWYVYCITQAPLHACVMHAFSRHLAKL